MDDNKGMFHVGTQFVGCVNGVVMKVVALTHNRLMTASGNIRVSKSFMATVEDMKTGKRFRYGLRALEKCDVIILN